MKKIFFYILTLMLTIACIKVLFTNRVLSFRDFLSYVENVEVYQIPTNFTKADILNNYLGTDLQVFGKGVSAVVNFVLSGFQYLWYFLKYFIGF